MKDNLFIPSVKLLLDIGFNLDIISKSYKFTDEELEEIENYKTKYKTIKQNRKL